MTTAVPETFATAARDRLRTLTGDPAADFRPDQLEAIRDIVLDRARVLCVQRTGWVKSAVYFVATALLRDAGAGPTLIVSPLPALMRNQIVAAERLGLRACTINSTNREDWNGVRDRPPRHIFLRARSHQAAPASIRTTPNAQDLTPQRRRHAARGTFLRISRSSASTRFSRRRRPSSSRSSLLRP